MKLRNLAESLDMKILTGEENIDIELSGVYICDLLSWVMSHADKGNIWVTVHTHLNIVAVALLTEVACIIVPEGIEVEEATIKKATEEGVNILSSNLSAYEVCCKTFQLGI